MKKRQMIAVGCMLLSIVFIFINFGQTSEAAERKFKTVGYLPDYDVIQAEHTVDLDQFTDINFFSMVPKKNGELEFADSGGNAQMLKDFVKMAHKKQVRIGVSIGGWGSSDNFFEATSDANRKKFISEIVKLTETYDLDTIDIDWEYPEENQAEQFEVFMKELKAILEPMGIKISICVPTGIGSNGYATGDWKKHFTSNALNYADWINIMSYDAQVEGYPDHAPVELQLNALNYWNELMGGDKMNKLVAGVPFYAKSVQGNVITYNKVVDIFAEKVEGNMINYQGEEYYFNSQEIIKKKTEDSIEAGALGVMVWTPTQDAGLESSNRLTDTLMETIKADKSVKLDKAQVLFGNVPIKEIKKFPFRFLFNLIALLLVLLGGILYKGLFDNIIPDTIFGKKINREHFNKLLTAICLVIAFLVLVFVNLPWYLILLLFTALAGGAYYLLKL